MRSSNPHPLPPFPPPLPPPHTQRSHRTNPVCHSQHIQKLRKTRDTNTIVNAAGGSGTSTPAKGTPKKTVTPRKRTTPKKAKSKSTVEGDSDGFDSLLNKEEELSDEEGDVPAKRPTKRVKNEES